MINLIEFVKQFPNNKIFVYENEEKPAYYLVKFIELGDNILPVQFFHMKCLQQKCFHFEWLENLRHFDQKFIKLPLVYLYIQE